ncbi:hypothetical protein C7B90_22810 [Lysinibacillus fusiformis]|nr:hypothetical protein C7B90_22810 [Lysinibacillus fusiformis]
MTKKGIYFAKNAFYQIIKNVGGEWNDQKERPLVALIPSNVNPEIYWAIPMGDYDHRTEQQKKRIKSYMNRGNTDISSCYYHVGKTDKKSIFFISDVVPITLNYIEREYLIGKGETRQQYIIKNPNLIKELERKVGRIISFEKNYVASKGQPKFRQRILDIHNYLLAELASVPTAIAEVAAVDETDGNE